MINGVHLGLKSTIMIHQIAVILNVLWLLIDVTSGSRKRADEIPTPPLARGKCRMLFNEINVDPASSGGQFIEIGRYCSDNSKYVPIGMRFFAVVIISRTAQVLAVCHMKHQSTPKKVVNGTVVVAKQILYTVGGDSVGPFRDMPLSDCDIADTFTDASGKKHLPLGTNFPVSMALLYNEIPSSLLSISLKNDGAVRVPIDIDDKLHKKILTNLQDYVVYTTSSPFTKCEYFSTFFSGYGNRSHILREWHAVRESEDRSLSRCGSNDPNYEGKLALPFMPELFVYSPKTPGAPNDCENSIPFSLEEVQPPAKSRKVDNNLVPPEHACYSETEDSAHEQIGTAAYPTAFQAALETRFHNLQQCQRMQVPAAPGMSSSHSSTNPDADELICDTAPESSTEDTTDSITSTTESLFEESTRSPTLPTNNATAFEDMLQDGSPYLWDDCRRLEMQPYFENLTSGRYPAFKREVLLDKDVCNWFQLVRLTNDAMKFRCRLCNKILDKIVFDRPRSSQRQLLMTDGQGYAPDPKANSRNGALVENHLKNRIHLIAVDYFRLYDQGLRGDMLKREFERKEGPFREFMDATENLIVAVFQSVRIGITFHSFEVLMETLQHYGVNVGRLYQNSDGMKRILMAISDHMHADLVAMLQRTKPKFSFTVDAYTDISKKQSLAVAITTYDDSGNLRVYLYKVLPLPGGETSENMYRLLMESIRKDGLTDWVRESCIGFTSDGGSNVIKLREMLDKVTDHPLFAVHCQAHRIELLNKRAWDKFEYLVLVDSIVNELYSSIKNSPKKKAEVSRAGLELGDTEFELKGIRRIRWINHKLRALDTLLGHWPTIVRALDSIQSDKTYELKERKQIRMLMGYLKDGTYIATLAFAADVSDLLASLSLRLQDRGSTLIGKREKRQQVRAALLSLKAEWGPKLNTVLQNATDATGRQGLSLVEFETGNVTLYGEQLYSPDPDDEADRLYMKYESYIDAILEQMGNYFPEDVADNLDVFDPLKWTTDNIGSFGETELLQMNKDLKWNFADRDLARDWKNLKEQISTTPEYEKIRNQKPELFWNYYLQNKNVTWHASLKVILTNILTVSASTSEIERIFSLYTAVKTSRRWNLKVESCDAILRIKYNGPQSLKEFRPLEVAKRFLLKHSRSDDESRVAEYAKSKQGSDDVNEFDDVQEV